MKPIVQRLAMAGVLACAAAGAGAAVSVTYVAPENYADMPRSAAEREDLLKDLSGHFAKLGRRLPPGQDLRVDVLDLDLAGRLVPSMRWGRDVRILGARGIDSPRMALRFSLTQNGQVIRSGEVRLADINYYQHRPHYWDNEPLRYEKTLIDNWFQQDLGVSWRSARR